MELGNLLSNMNPKNISLIYMSYKTLISDFCKASNLNEKLRPYIKARKVWITGKSFLELLILASTNPKYDKRLFIELKSTQYKKLVPNAFRLTY